MPPRRTAPRTTEARANREAIDRIHERVRLYARRRAAWLRHIWDQETHAARSAGAVAPPEVDALLRDDDAPAREARWIARAEAAAEINEAIAAVEAAMADDETSRWARLLAEFALAPAEADLLQAALALEVDPGLQRVFAYLHDHAAKPYLTDALAGRLFGHGRTALRGDGSALRAWRMVVEHAHAPGEAPAVTIDPSLRDWLIGGDQADPRLPARAVEPRSALESWPVNAGQEFLREALAQAPAARLTIHGTSGSGRRTYAASVAAALDMPAIAIDADAIPEHDWPDAVARAWRAAHLQGAALIWAGQQALTRPWPGLRPPTVQFVSALPSAYPRELPGVAEHALELPTPGLDERRALWRGLVAGARRWRAADLDALVRRYRVTVGEVAAVALHGAPAPAGAEALLREHGRRELGGLAEVLECPFRWDDLVVHPAVRRALEELVYEAQERPRFWERPEARRLFPGGRGLVALFSGPPGTGKTMAAQVIAAELGVDLVRVDLSSVVSKYVGETSQNLERILSRAAQLDVVLFFDEADALFGRRTEVRDAHDRFANTDTGFLLQAIESYPGVALLATNRKSDIDQAFLRRLRYVAEFRKPDLGERKRIWERVVGELAGAERAKALDGGLQALAAGVEATGAEIKFAILNGIFLAQREERPLAVPHLVRGLERELLKEGKTLSAREQEGLLRHAG